MNFQGKINRERNPKPATSISSVAAMAQNERYRPNEHPEKARCIDAKRMHPLLPPSSSRTPISIIHQPMSFVQTPDHRGLLHLRPFPQRFMVEIISKYLPSRIRQRCPSNKRAADGSIAQSRVG
jgi:hypothetical protein